ncbi:MAG TPA: chemotaxis protein CheD [Gemmatimonadales bacterium]|nr:chemotaxis protein CheD [Gemmatimonadales bacterium]
MSDPIIVRVAELHAASGDAVLATMGLGSCVAIALHDAASRVGGLAHILLPSRSLSRSGDNPGRFPQTALPALIEEMILLGAERRRLVARLVGGASMFSNLVPAGSMQMGDRNVIAVREVLHQLAVPIVGELVGGNRGRSVWFHVADGRILIRVVGERDEAL